MDENLTELQRKVLALLTTIQGRAARYRLCEIHDRLTELLRKERETAEGWVRL